MTRGTGVDTNQQLWPLEDHVGDLQHPVAVIPPTAAQLASHLVAARWASRQTFHRMVVAWHNKTKKVKKRESLAERHDSSTSRGATSTPQRSTEPRHQPSCGKISAEPLTALEPLPGMLM